MIIKQEIKNSSRSKKVVLSHVKKKEKTKVVDVKLGSNVKTRSQRTGNVKHLPHKGIPSKVLKPKPKSPRHKEEGKSILHTTPSSASKRSKIQKGKNTEIRIQAKKENLRPKNTEPKTGNSAPRELKSREQALKENAVFFAFNSPPSPALLESFRKANASSKKVTGSTPQDGFIGKGFLAKSLKDGKRYTVDLRIHSPGTNGYFSTGGVEAVPAIVRLAKVKGLHIIGLTDYYNASYIDEVQRTALENRITLIPGFDLKCIVGACREVYVVALFPENVGEKELFKILEELHVPPTAYGERDYCLETSFSQIIKVVEDNAGVLIPSRLDKTPYRQLAIPTLVEKFGFHAFDLVHSDQPDFFQERWPRGEFTFFSFSNANALAQIGSRITKIRLHNPDFNSIRELVKRR